MPVNNQLGCGFTDSPTLQAVGKCIFYSTGLRIMQTLLCTHPMVVEWTEVTMAELAISHRASDFWFLIIATFYFWKGRTATFTCLPHIPYCICFLLNRAPTRLSEGLEDFLATAGVQTAGGGGGSEAVRVPVVSELLLQSWCQRLNGTNSRCLQHTRVHGGTEISMGKTV